MTPLVALVLLALLGSSSGVSLTCVQVPGALVQIDAGNGQVFGVNKGGNIYTLYGGKWIQLPGALSQVSVGAAGVWGVTQKNNIYKLVGGDWVQTNGMLKQIDAGGVQFVIGANSNDDVYCLGNNATVSAKDDSPLPWMKVEVKMKYCSCGPSGCWGVNSANAIYYQYSTTPNSCAGTKWQKISGELGMIEVGRDGSVYGINSIGALYRREGITAQNPTGTFWTKLEYQNLKFKHVSEDLGRLWLITEQETIFRCQT